MELQVSEKIEVRIIARRGDCRGQGLPSVQDERHSLNSLPCGAR